MGFAGALFSSEHNQTFRTEGSIAKLERDPENEHRFILNIDGVSVFQWFRDMARKLLEKLGFRPKEPTQSHGIRRWHYHRNHNGYLSTITSTGGIAVIFTLHYKSA